MEGECFHNELHQKKGDSFKIQAVAERIFAKQSITKNKSDSNDVEKGITNAKYIRDMKKKMYINDFKGRRSGISVVLTIGM